MQNKFSDEDSLHQVALNPQKVPKTERRRLEYLLSRLTKVKGSSLQKAYLAYDIGQELSQKSQYQEALEHFRNAEKIFQEKKQERDLACVFAEQGKIYLRIGQLKNASQAHQKGLQLFRKLGDRSGEAAQLGNLNLIYNDQGETEKALNTLQKSLDLHQELGLKDQQVVALINLGIFFRKQGAFEKSLLYFQQGLQIVRESNKRKTKKPFEEASILTSIASLKMEKGETEESRSLSHQALKIFQDLGDIRGEAEIVGRLGSYYRITGELNQAFKYHERSIQLYRNLGDIQGEADQLRHRGLLHAALGDLDPALSFSRESLTLFKEIGFEEGEADSLGQIGYFLGEKDKFREALNYCEEAVEKYKKLGSKLKEIAQSGMIHYFNWKPDNNREQSLEQLKEVLRLCRESGLKLEETYMENKLGQIYLQLKEYRKAVDFFKGALQKSQNLQSLHWQAVQMTHLGICYQHLKDYIQALSYLKRAEKLFEKAGISISKAFFSLKEDIRGSTANSTEPRI